MRNRTGGAWLVTDMDRSKSIFEVNPTLQVRSYSSYKNFNFAYLLLGTLHVCISVYWKLGSYYGAGMEANDGRFENFKSKYIGVLKILNILLFLEIFSVLYVLPPFNISQIYFRKLDIGFVCLFDSFFLLVIKLHCYSL